MSESHLNMGSLRFRTRPIQSRIDSFHHPSESLLVHEFAQRSEFILRLLLCSRLRDPFPTSADLGSQDSLCEVLS